MKYFWIVILLINLFCAITGYPDTVSYGTSLRILNGVVAICAATNILFPTKERW